MADITVTAANVGYKGPCRVRVVQVGESVTQGQSGYLSTDGLYYKADANASAATAAAAGVFTSAASTNGWASIVDAGPMNPGATLVVGESYFVSATAGGIAPSADVTTGWYPRFLGQATAADTLLLAPSGGTVARA